MGRNKGFVSSAGAFVRQIRVNLRDRYVMDDAGFTLLKELLQNADDAGASVLNLGWTPGISCKEHPLLGGPALFVVNDGLFKPSDEEQIRSFGHNAKAGEKATIGKFGLGLKSVFHLCEAFFFLARRGDERLGDVLNPWSSGQPQDMHPEWDEFPETGQKAILGHLDRLLLGDRWFCMWIPLRMQSQLGGKDPIMPSFPGDSANSRCVIVRGGTPGRLGAMLPLLAHVEQIQGWIAEGSGLRQQYEVSLVPPIRRSAGAGVLPFSRQKDFSGRIQIAGSESSEQRYAGMEAELDDEVLRGYEEHGCWPRDLYTDPNTGREMQTAEKAEQHAAVCFVTGGVPLGREAQLDVSWCVFLPLATFEAVRIPGAARDVSLMLHGYFFIDAGRNHVDGLDREPPEANVLDQAGLRQAWNHRLSAEGTLPMVPTALKRFIEETEWSHDETGALTAAIAGTGLFERYRSAICRDHNWLLVHRAPDRSNWELLPSSQRFYELPFPRKGILPSSIFPALMEVAEQNAVTFCGFPRLAACGGHDWPADRIAVLLDSVVASEVFADAPRLQYLVEFVTGCCSSAGLAICTQSLVELTRRALREVSWAPLSEKRGVVQRLVGAIPADRRVRLELPDSELGGALLQELCDAPISLALIPSSLELPGQESRGKLSLSEAKSLLRRVAEWRNRDLSKSDLQVVAEVAGQLFQACGAKEEELLRECGDLMLFVATDCGERKKVDVSLRQLLLQHQNRLLFSEPGQFAYQLQQALSDERILLISGRLFRLLLPGSEPSQCSHRDVLATLGRATPPRLAAPRGRRDLLEKLLAYQEGRRTVAYRECVRFLLTGDSDLMRSQLRLVVGRGQTRDLWSRVTDLSLQQLQAQSRLIAPMLGSLLSSDDREILGVDEACASSATALLREAGGACLAGLEPTEEEYDELLRVIDDVEVCRSLPIHRDIAGNFTAIDAYAFWEGDFCPGPELQRQVRILRRSRTERTWARQRELAQQLDAFTALDLVLRQPEPGRFAEVVMNALEKGGLPPGDVVERLRKANWLPTLSASHVCPDDVIHLPSVEDEVARVTGAYPGLFWDEKALVPEIRNHLAYDLVQRHLFPTVQRGLEMLGLVLEETEDNRIGGIEVEAFGDWLESMTRAPEALVPCYGLLRKVADRHPGQVAYILKQLAKPIRPERVRSFLDFLRETHSEDKSAVRRGKVLNIYHQYLRMVITPENYRHELATIPLLSRSEKWRSASELCLDGTGIADDCLLCGATADVLTTVLASQALVQAAPSSRQRRDGGMERRELQSITDLLGTHGDADSLQEWRKRVEGAAGELATYFAPWKGLVCDEHIGAFLALLGDAPDVRRLAEEYLGLNRTVEQTRANFGLSDADGANFRVVVGISRGKTERVPNLLGEWCEVRKSDRVDNLFVGFGTAKNPFPRISVFGWKVICVCLNEFDPNVSETDLSRVLRDSVVRLRNIGFDLVWQDDQVAQFWDDLSQSDQLDINVAQSRLVENGFLLLDQLGLRADPRLAVVLDQWDSAQRLEAEQESGLSAKRRVAGRPAREETERAKRELRRLLEGDDAAQRSILTAVRERIGSYYQYTLSSIPFELFQNADDAYVELHKYFPGRSNAESVPALDVLCDGSRVVFVHGGRQINQYPLGADRSLSLRFDNDVWRMLVLSLSNKVVGERRSETSVTGKFGLGFKSVFLASDRPRILSGRLSFEVMGGMYPRRLGGAERQGLEVCGRQASGPGRLSTVIELPLREEVGDGKSLLDDFVTYLHLLVVFARRIRRCRLTMGGAAETVEWQDVPVGGVAGCRCGMLEPVVTARQKGYQRQNALVFRAGESVVLLALDARGVVPLPDEVPSIWVTAPTRESLTCGLVVNGPFALDVGRQRLASDDAENQRVAAECGVALGRQLCNLFEASKRNWAELCEALRLIGDADRYDFWRSFWQLLCLSVARGTVRAEPADRLLREIFWGNAEQGVAKLYQQHEAIPSGLVGDHRVLTAVPRVRWAIRGILSKDPNTFAEVSSWPSFRRFAPIGAVVAEEVLEPLRILAPDAASPVAALTFVKALEWELGDGRYADPEQAEQQGRLVNSEFLDAIKDRVEEAQVRDYLRQVQFLAHDGQYHPARELLVGHVTGTVGDRREDERLRAEFAPDSALLDQRYKGPAVAFFEACRGRLEAPVQRMVEWVISADNRKRRLAALNYLLRGTGQGPLGQALVDRGLYGTWLEDLRSSELFQSLETADQYRLAGLLKWPSLERLGPEPPAPPPPPSAESLLVAIHDWWQRERSQRLARYLKGVYPGAEPELNDGSTNSEEFRKGWMTLFLIGLTHTMGRAVSEQHRSFLVRCEQRGWLGMFASSSRDPARWMQFVEEYVDRQVDDNVFLQWMKQFVGIFAVSRYLDEHIEAFLAIERFRHPFSLTAVTRTRTAAQFQQGGVSAPSISGVLGMGACFVVRELVRQKVITNELAYPHCFVPVKRVRDLFSMMGCDGLDLTSQRWEMSRNIYSFACEHLGPEGATFLKDFDIPLQIVAEDIQLQQEVLRQQLPPDDGEDGDGSAVLRY